MSNIELIKEYKVEISEWKLKNSYEIKLILLMEDNSLIIVSRHTDNLLYTIHHFFKEHNIIKNTLDLKTSDIRILLRNISKLNKLIGILTD